MVEIAGAVLADRVKVVASPVKCRNDLFCAPGSDKFKGLIETKLEELVAKTFNEFVQTADPVAALLIF